MISINFSHLSWLYPIIIASTVILLRMTKSVPVRLIRSYVCDTSPTHAPCWDIASLRLIGQGIGQAACTVSHKTYRQVYCVLFLFGFLMILNVSTGVFTDIFQGYITGSWAINMTLNNIIWTNAEMLLIRTLETNLSEILIKIYPFSFTKMHLNMSPRKWRPFCLGLNVLKEVQPHQFVSRIFVSVCFQEHSNPIKCRPYSSAVTKLPPLLVVCW